MGVFKTGGICLYTGKISMNTGITCMMRRHEISWIIARVGLFSRKMAALAMVESPSGRDVLAEGLLDLLKPAVQQLDLHVHAVRYSNPWPCDSEGIRLTITRMTVPGHMIGVTSRGFVCMGLESDVLKIEYFCSNKELNSMYSAYVHQTSSLYTFQSWVMDNKFFFSTCVK